MNWKTDRPIEDGMYLVTIEIYGERRIDTCYYSTITQAWGNAKYEKVLAWDYLPATYDGKKVW